MKKTTNMKIWLLFLALPLSTWAGAPENNIDNKHFKPLDVFQLEWASDPQVSPDGKKIVYVRNFMDIMTDRRRSNLWIINYDGTDHRPLTTGNQNDSSPRWSPDGARLLYVSKTDDESSQLYVRWMDSGQTAKLTNLTHSPNDITWSPDGKWIALSMLVKEPSKPFADTPAKPKGAEWAKPARVIDKVRYRFDGVGYLEDGYTHLFVLPAEGGTPRQITAGQFNHGSTQGWSSTPAWSLDGKALIFSANLNEDWEFDNFNYEIYEASLVDGSITALTGHKGPETNPVLSPDGKQIAYLLSEDIKQAFQVTKLYVMNRDGSGKRVITKDFDRYVQHPVWSGDGGGIYFQYDDEGNTKIGYVSLSGKVQTFASDVGGTSIGRPYSGGSFSVAKDGRFAYTQSRPDYPADVAVGHWGSSNVKRITKLNEDLFGHKKLGDVEEIWYNSSHDGRRIQGWIVKPPDFDPGKKYPLILEIHGGPWANYGARFTAEIQLYAAAGYVVLYTNPRGSTGYGQEFGDLIYGNYPGEDYDDLMSGVDAVIQQGYIDEDNLFVTGGSGGGILTSWIVGKTNRFRAAVVAKPVTNWYTKVLTCDTYTFYKKGHGFPGWPWESPEHYLRRSPISLVGNVTTPTMLLAGDADYRTPIVESEQYYQALKLRKIDTALVIIPGASHHIALRPSNLIAKVVHILKWFERYRTTKS